MKTPQWMPLAAGVIFYITVRSYTACSHEKYAAKPCAAVLRFDSNEARFDECPIDGGVK